MDARGGCTAFSATKFEDGYGFDRPEAEANHHRHNHATEGSEGQDEVTDEPHLPRFLVRRGATRGWMVGTDIPRARLSIWVMRSWD
jgi:hypothetical protein